MDYSTFVVQVLNGFAEASSLFLIAAGLSIIFGVTRVVNFAHGSFYMVGAYTAITLVQYGGNSIWFWPALLVGAVAAALLGLLIEITLLRRIYHAPELMQLLATYAVMLIVHDAVLYLWGPTALLGPRAPGLDGSIDVLGLKFPTYSLFLIAIGPIALALLWMSVTKTRWGRLVRAATQDRDMVSALGVNHAWLFTSVFVLGTFVAGLGGALQLPREPANLDMDINAIATAFVVVVVGGLGSLPGAFLAAVIVAQAKALCLWLGVIDIGPFSISLPKFTLVVEFVVMAVVLVIRPYGLMGTAPSMIRQSRTITTAMATSPLSSKGLIVAVAIGVLLLLTPQLRGSFPYFPILLVEIMIMIILASSLQLLSGPGGMHSFGHAVYFGLGAYGAAMAAKYGQMPLMTGLAIGCLLAFAGSIVIGWFSVRLRGVYLAMLTLAFAQIVWGIFFQFEGLAGGENGITGIWPSGVFKSRDAFFYLVFAALVVALVVLYRALFSPFGYALRASRDSLMKSESIGINSRALQWAAFAITAPIAGLAGGLFAFSKGSISPEVLGSSHSLEALVMVVLGGEFSVGGGAIGAAVFSWLRDYVGYNSDYWRAVLGAITLVLLLVMPQGLTSLPALVANLGRGKR